MKSSKKSLKKKKSMAKKGLKSNRFYHFSQTAFIATVLLFIRIVYIYTYSGDNLISVPNDSALRIVGKMLLNYLVYSGLYLFYFEVLNFGWPEEKIYIKFGNIVQMIYFVIVLCSFIGINVSDSLQEYFIMYNNGSDKDQIGKELQKKLNLQLQSSGESSSLVTNLVSMIEKFYRNIL